MEETIQSMELAQNYKTVKENVTKACEQAGRSEQEVTLLAVSKTKPVDMLMDVYRAGARDFGENKVQELVDKIPQMPSDVRWHMIGHLQRNKVKYIVSDMDLIHSVDSVKLAAEIDRQAKRVGKVQDILMEVNIGAEASKSGVMPDELPELLAQAAEFSNIRVKGLMTIPPPGDNEKFLFEMQKLFLDISAKKMDNIDMDILSMGMSGDYADAIRYGATIVRIGSALFGARKYPQK